MRRVGLCAVFAVATLCVGAGAAWAHGDIVKTDPKKNTEIAMPKVVSVTLSEAPVPQSKLAVTDGCGRDVTEEVSVQDDTLQASIGDAQPGKWKAAYRVVSAVDGHPTEDNWAFTVEGTADCDGETEEVAPTIDPSPEPTDTADETSNAAGDDSATTNASDSEESSFPVVPVALGGVALVAIAAFVRAKSSS
jgi:methionine-rich copper-binding protein CopC